MNYVNSERSLPSFCSRFRSRGAALACVSLACVAMPALASAAEPDVAIVIGPDAPALERLAAEEVAEHLQLLFNAQTAIATVRPAEKAAVLVGSPATNPAVKAALGDKWPKLTDQGHLLKSVASPDGPVLVVGGGSPAATYWAAAELGHRFGIRALPSGNLPPEEKPAFSIADLDVVLEPSLTIRGWTLMDATPVGPAAWGLDDHKRLLRQLARMKFNRIVLDVQPWQPFVAWSYEGVKKTSDDLWPGGAIPVDGDTAGRAAFRGAAHFDNPDFAGKTTPDERIKAGVALLSGIIDEAHRYGMTVALSVPPFDFPKEFAPKLPDSIPSALAPELALTPGMKMPLAGPETQALALAQLRAYVETYPKLDLLVLSATFDWTGNAAAAWARLQQTGTIPKTATLEQTADEARKRKGLLGGDEGVIAVAAQVAAIPALRMLAENPDLPKRKDAPPIPVELGGVDPALARLGLRITPAGANVLFLPAAGGEKEKAPDKPLKLTATLDWSDYLVGVLPRLHSRSTAAAMTRLTSERWAGFVVNAVPMSGVDPTAYFVSRAAFDPSLTPEASLRDLVDRVAGEGVAGRVVKGFAMIEEAADAVDLNALTLAAPDKEVFQRRLIGDTVPEWWTKLRDANLEAMNEMYRANTRARQGGREFTLYFARKFEFAFETMNALEAMRLAQIARSNEHPDKEIEHLEKAIESIYGGLGAYAAVARDPSDRGVIALLNAHAYRFLQKRLEAAEAK